VAALIATPSVLRFSAWNPSDFGRARASAGRLRSPNLVGRAVRAAAGEYERLNKTMAAASFSAETDFPSIR